MTWPARWLPVLGAVLFFVGGAARAHDTWFSPMGGHALALTTGNRYPVAEVGPGAASVARSGCSDGETDAIPLRPAREQALQLDMTIRATDAELAIFDLVGRRVATLHQGLLPAGNHPFRWDGRHTDGTRARDGVYFCRVLGAGASATRRLILIGGR